MTGGLPASKTEGSSGRSPSDTQLFVACFERVNDSTLLRVEKTSEKG